MNINLIKKDGYLYDLAFRGKYILELYYQEHKPVDLLRIYLYDIANNTVEELLPDVEKVIFVKFYVAYKSCEDIYYATYKDLDNGQIEIKIRAYNLNSKKTTILCSFKETDECLSLNKRIRVFILNPNNFLIQTEEVSNEETDRLMGNIKFTQTLYSTDKEEPVTVIEENLNNNGINSIIPLNDTEILIKTGFSFLEDSRLTYASMNEALIESVYRTTSMKFLSAIMLQQGNIDMEPLTTTYFDKYILKPEVKDEYIYYNVVDINAKQSECFFINFVTGEKYTVKISNIDEKDLRISYVVNNDPYIRQNTEESYEFINMKTAENDISFYDDIFVDIIGKLFICTNKSGRHSHLRIYNYPRMDVVLNEKYTFIAGINNGEEYYLYVE